MTEEQRTEINDMAAQTENVYKLRQLVQIATDSSVGYNRMLECHNAALKQANDFMKEVLEMTKPKDTEGELNHGS